MSEELKPCPFCGESGIALHLSREKDSQNMEWQYRIVCDYTLGGCGYSGGFGTDPKKVIEAWNGRAI